jgi:MFS family permease
MAMSATSGGERAAGSRLYRYYFLAMCCALFFLSYADRQLFGVLLSPIKAEFHLSDTALGLLSGLTFGLFYAVWSLPLARLADRTSRKWVMTVCLAAWSVATMACGAAQNTFHLVLARLSVGIGEAGGTPASISAISDLFPKTQRATAIAFFNAAGSIGGAAVISVGAWLAATYSWRIAFVIVGIPGVILAVLMALTLREPERGAADQVTDAGTMPTFRETIAYIFRRPVIIYAFVGAALGSAIVSLTQWLPAFFQRSHGMSLVEAGGFVGLALLLAGPFGELLGGQVSDRVGARGTSRVLIFMAVISVATGISGVLMSGVGSVALAVATMVVWKVVATAFPPPTWALSQSLVEIRMRATSQAIIGIFQNLIGYGMSPVLVGFLSELYRPTFGEDSLRWALITTMGGLSAVATLVYLAGARAAARDEGP